MGSRKRPENRHVLKRAIKQKKERFRKLHRDHVDHTDEQQEHPEFVPIRKRDTYIDELEKQGREISFEPASVPDFKGMVVELYPRGALVRRDEGSYVLCEIAEYLWSKNESPVAAGDIVHGQFAADDSYDYDGIVTSVEKRSSVLSVPDSKRQDVGTVYEKILAANIDVFIAVDSLANPEVHLPFVDRFLIVGQREGDKTVVFCVNKTDLGAGIPEEVMAYRDCVDHLVFTSAKTGQGVDELKKIIGSRKAVMAGRSGVGKSSLLNAMFPGLDLEARPVIRKSGKGAHTTRRYSLYELENGGMIIDTPGIKEIHLINIEPSELTWYFPEFISYRGGCKFSDCTHTHEPVCGVKQAVEAGDIPALRYESYLRILGSLEKGKRY